MWENYFSRNIFFNHYKVGLKEKKQKIVKERKLKSAKTKTKKKLFDNSIKLTIELNWIACNSSMNCKRMAMGKKCVLMIRRYA